MFVNFAKLTKSSSQVGSLEELVCLLVDDLPGGEGMGYIVITITIMMMMITMMITMIMTMIMMIMMLKPFYQLLPRAPNHPVPQQHSLL